jgi:hypothetical protein
MDLGRRSETDLSVGFKLGKMTRWACFQSRILLESWFAQNSRSSSSLWNSGIALFIDRPFSLAHVTRRDHADFFIANRKNDKQSAYNFNQKIKYQQA